MGTPNLGELALLALQKKNPAALNTELGQQFIQILKTGNYQLGEQIARNICSTYGETENDAVNHARQFFNL